jgi:hypothetical protein
MMQCPQAEGAYQATPSSYKSDQAFYSPAYFGINRPIFAGKERL